MRQNHLVIDGWFVIRFTFDDINEKPRRCQQVLQQLLGRWSKGIQGNEEWDGMSSQERDVVRLGLLESRIKVRTVAEFLNITTDQARYLLKKMTKRNIIAPTDTQHRRVHGYKVVRVIPLREMI